MPQRSPSTMLRVLSVGLLLTTWASFGCHQPSKLQQFRPTQDVVVCGERIPIGSPVILWTDPGGFNAYHPGPVYAATGPAGLRYTPGRSWADPKTVIDRAALSERIDQLVVHYDGCGFSQRCFRLLQDERVLSAHFMLDVDGTLYQTLDLRDQAWHGRSANARSIGVEIAHVGVYEPDNPSNDPHQKRRWYVRDAGRLHLSIPAEFGDTHVRLPGPFYSARNEPLRGEIHGKYWEQVDFTPQQYESLIKLTTALRRMFPRIRLDVPRKPDGTIRTDLLSKEELADFTGILGHYHITTERNDPGPAFDWDRLLREVRRMEPATIQ